MKSTLIERLEEEITNHINSGKRFIIVAVGNPVLKVGDICVPDYGIMGEFLQSHPGRVVAVCSFEEYLENNPDGVVNAARYANSFIDKTKTVHFYEIHFD